MLDVFWNFLFTSLVVGVLSALLRYVWYLVVWNTRRDLPPGPRGLPLVGYLPFMPKDGHWGIERLRQKYGNVFGLQLGCRYVVFLCDFASIREGLSQDALLDRPEEFPFNINKGAESILLLNGPPWKEQRRFSVKALKELLSVTQNLEAQIHEELPHLLRELASLKGEAVYPGSFWTSSTSNVISALLFGRRLGYDDPERVRLDELVDLIAAQVNAQLSAVNFVPRLRKLLVFLRLGAYGKLRKAFARRNEFSDSMIDFHMATYKEGVARDFIDVFLREMKKDQGRKTFTRNVLRSNVSSFLVAGSDTLRIALEWLLLTCAAKPELQSRIQVEIDAALKRNGEGGSPCVSWKYHGLMPYTQAFIWETMRCKPVNPLGLMRCANEDVKVGGYVIPRGSVVVTSLWSVLHDASFWGDPEVFRPERFLTDDGTRASKPERLIPFSYGKRSCPGDGIANIEMFVFLATILRHFTVEPPPGVRALAFDESHGASPKPKPQKLVFRSREVFG